MSVAHAWKAYSPAELHNQYIVREQVPEFRSYLDRWKETSAPVRAAHGGHLDIPYGAHPAETLDVLLPGSPAPGNPVQVLFHGGYWRALHKDEYAFTAAAGLAAGVAAVVINYELCPRVTMSELVAQCQRGLEWTIRHIAELGPDPHRLYLSGHSAGGHLTGEMLATDWAARGLAGAFTIRDICALSGLYDLTPMPFVSVQDDVHLTDAEVEALSPVRKPLLNVAPMLLAAGGLESAEFHRQTADYAAHCRAAGADVTVELVPGRHHYSVVDAFADPAHPLCQAWLARILG